MTLKIFYFRRAWNAARSFEDSTRAPRTAAPYTGTVWGTLSRSPRQTSAESHWGFLSVFLNIFFTSELAHFVRVLSALPLHQPRSAFICFNGNEFLRLFKIGVNMCKCIFNVLHRTFASYQFFVQCAFFCWFCTRDQQCYWLTLRSLHLRAVVHHFSLVGVFDANALGPLDHHRWRGRIFQKCRHLRCGVFQSLRVYHGSLTKTRAALFPVSMAMSCKLKTPYVPCLVLFAPAFSLLMELI